jgi:hypothetical protein
VVPGSVCETQALSGTIRLNAKANESRLGIANKIIALIPIALRKHRTKPTPLNLAPFRYHSFWSFLPKNAINEPRNSRRRAFAHQTGAGRSANGRLRAKRELGDAPTDVCAPNGSRAERRRTFAPQTGAGRRADGRLRTKRELGGAPTDVCAILAAANVGILLPLAL